MAYNKSDAKKLGVAGALNKPCAQFSEYSVDDVKTAFRNQIKELVPDYNAWRRNKEDVFELMQEIFDEVLPKKVLARYNDFAEIRFVNHGQKAVFKKKLGRARAKTFITRVGLGGIFETFRLDVSEFEVPIDAIGGAATIDFERLLSGQEDIAEAMDILMEGMDEAISRMIGQALNATINATRPENTKHTDSDFDETEFRKLLNTVRAYGDPVIVCTPEFADTIPATSITVGDTAFVSDMDVNDLRALGRIRMYRGTPIVVLDQSFEDETNTTKVLDPKYCYIFPGDQRVVKMTFEGGMIVDEWKNKDRSMEIQCYQKCGAAVMHYNNWAIYENTSLV